MKPFFFPFPVRYPTITLKTASIVTLNCIITRHTSASESSAYELFPATPRRTPQSVFSGLKADSSP